MREIKFRAWDTADKEFITNTDDLMMEISNGSCFYYYLNDVIRVPLELTQYTGLKDKNGAEIFEDDICHSNRAYYKVVRHKNGIYELHLINKKEFPNISDCHVVEQCLHIIEVIGNIYENKELLYKC